jgi:NAD-dependent DNA ligase
MRDKISKKLGSIPPPAVTTVSSSSKTGSKSHSGYDQKRHDEQMKSIKEMIKSKVGDSHMRREEEQRLEKER